MNTTRKGFLASLGAIVAAPFVKAKADEPPTFPTNLKQGSINKIIYFTSTNYYKLDHLGRPVSGRDLEPLPKFYSLR